MITNILFWLTLAFVALSVGYTIAVAAGKANRVPVAIPIIQNIGFGFLVIGRCFLLLDTEKNLGYIKSFIPDKVYSFLLKLSNVDVSEKTFFMTLVLLVISGAVLRMFLGYKTLTVRSVVYSILISVLIAIFSPEHANLYQALNCFTIIMYIICLIGSKISKQYVEAKAVEMVNGRVMRERENKKKVKKASKTPNEQFNDGFNSNINIEDN